MKKNLLLFFLILSSLWSFSQTINSIRPNYGAKGTTLQTVITMPNGTFQSASPPQGSSDIYLQQGATLIYVNSFDPMVNIYQNGAWPNPFTDSMFVDWSLPSNAPSGSYDVHVFTYNNLVWPVTVIDNVLTNGFTITGNDGTIQGDVYFDINQNGSRDVGELGLANQRILFSPSTIIGFTDQLGHYNVIIDTGTYTVSAVLQPTFVLTSAPSSYSVTVPPSTAGHDFGLYANANYSPQLFNVWHHPMRCNTSGYTYITQTNSGTVPVSGSITLVHSPNMPFNSSLPAPNYISGDTLRWDYASLQAGGVLQIGQPFIAFNDPAAGQTVWYNVIDSVFDGGGNFQEVLMDSFSFLVSCSCDPNEKMVTPVGITNQHYTPLADELKFTVNFQNTGNDTAFTVVIHDTLDTNLDLSTFKLLSSSHPVGAQMDANGALRFSFYNILLPDSNIDEPGSHGYVAYSIKPKTGLADPTVIHNTAHIVFDLNSAIVTNTSYNTLTALQYPSANFYLADPTICQSSCVSFVNNSTSGTSYHWNFTGGIPSTSNSENPGLICYNSAGQFAVQLIATNALGTDTLTQLQYVTVAPSPSGLNVVQSGDTLWANSGYNAYQWFFETDSIIGATGQYYIATSDGNYGLVVGNSNGCLAGLNIPNVVTVINELISNSGAFVYPNPNNGEFEIAFSAFGKTNATIDLINSIGQNVFHKSIEITTGVNKFPSDVKLLENGIYSLRIISGSQVIIRKILKIE